MLQRNSSKKNDSETKKEYSNIDKSNCYLSKGSKPLQKYRFYLDVKNYSITNKLEQKIKNLGGVVEFFLVEEVTHVVTDREDTFGNGSIVSPKTPSASLESNYESPKPSTSTPKPGNTRLKTRADAMLEKVRSQTVSKVADPLKNAKLWGIPIWTVNKVFSWLEKVSSSISFMKSTSKQVKPAKSSVREFPLKAPYIKFEPVTKDARPVYKALEHWPVLDLDGARGSCALRMKPRQEDDEKMTRKVRPRLSVRGVKETEEKTEKILHGYCEICHLEYRELSEHLRSETHQQFIKNDANYLTLDTLIGTTGNVEAFLRLNGGSICKDGLRRSLRNGRSPNGKYNGVDEDRIMTRGRTSYRAQFSGQSALSPTGSDSAHCLRSRGNLYGSLLGITADDEVCSTKPKECARQERKNSQIIEDDNRLSRSSDKFPEHGKSKKTCMKPKRISADERLVNDNRTYYKVEVMTTKLRSSGLGAREHEFSTTKTNSPIPEEHHDKETSLVVKFKKIRRSELAALNDEAENFMFPRKEDSSFGDLDTEDGPNTTYSPHKEHTIEILSSEFEKDPTYKETSEDSEEFLDTIALKQRFKTELEEKKIKKIEEGEETIGKRRSRRIIDYHEENSETEPNIKIRPRKNISYLEESSIDEEVIHPTPKINNILPIEENSEASYQKKPRQQIINSYRVSRPYKKTGEKDLIKRKGEIITNLDEVAQDVTNINIVRKKFKNSYHVKPTFKRKCTKRNNVIENHDETAQDGTGLCEITKKRYTKKIICVKRPYKRKYTRKNITIPANLDESAQDGTVMRQKRKYTKRALPIFDLEGSKDATSRDSVSCDSETRRRKRKSQAESFIEENRKYFKFDTPNSRLRYQGSIFGTIQSPPRINGEQQDEISDKERPQFSLDEVKYSFEIQPKSEPWYQTFTRQDRGEEVYTSLSDPGYQTRIILPYQLPATFEPLDPQVCISHYDRIKNNIINPETELEIKVEPSEDSQPVSEVSQQMSTVIEAPPKLDFHQRRRKKKRFNMKVNHPRKSPRQHASTLAILSSFINQRKKRERKSAGESDLSRNSLGPIPEEEMSTQKIIVQEENIREEILREEELLREELLRNEEVLRAEYNKDELEINFAALQCVSEILTAPIELDISEEINGVLLKEKPDAITLIENFKDYKATELTPCRTRIIRRKRKKNRTGWPKKKKLFPRKVGAKVEDNLALEEETRMTEGSLDETDDVKNSDEECSDLENRTMCAIEKTVDSVYSNCNVNEISGSSELKQGVVTKSSNLTKVNSKSQSNGVNIDLNTWENAEKVLHAKMGNNTPVKGNKLMQPYVRVKKLDGKYVKTRLRSSSSPERKSLAKRPRLSQPVSPRSPRKLRAPRGKWYRER